MERKYKLMALCAIALFIMSSVSATDGEDCFTSWSPNCWVIGDQPTCDNSFMNKTDANNTFQNCRWVASCLGLSNETGCVYGGTSISSSSSSSSFLVSTSSSVVSSSSSSSSAVTTTTTTTTLAECGYITEDCTSWGEEDCGYYYEYGEQGAVQCEWNIDACTATGDECEPSLCNPLYGQYCTDYISENDCGNHYYMWEYMFFNCDWNGSSCTYGERPLECTPYCYAEETGDCYEYQTQTECEEYFYDYGDGSYANCFWLGDLCVPDGMCANGVTTTLSTSTTTSTTTTSGVTTTTLTGCEGTYIPICWVLNSTTCNNYYMFDTRGGVYYDCVWDSEFSVCIYGEENCEGRSPTCHSNVVDSCYGLNQTVCSDYYFVDSDLNYNCFWYGDDFGCVYELDDCTNSTASMSTINCENNMNILLAGVLLLSVLFMVMAAYMVMKGSGDIKSLVATAIIIAVINVIVALLSQVC